jgi:molybdopterin-guanine dinucleotide biosynthesis protein A
VYPVSVAILAGGKSSRLQPPKALTLVASKPLVLHVVDACEGAADDIFIVVHTEEDRTELAQYYPEDQIVVDVLSEPQCPLVGALTAFRHARTPFTQLLPCDSPLIHPMFLEIMWAMVEDHHAAVPRWPNGWVEPLHSVFLSKLGAQVAEQCLTENQPRMRCLIERIGRVIYLSTGALARFDPKLNTFTNVNGPADLARIERLLSHRRRP